MEMSKAKLEAMCREFPFLHRYLYGIGRVVVSRVSCSLLKDGRKEGYVGGHSSVQIFCRAYFLDREGNQICEVGIDSAKTISFWRFWTWGRGIYCENIESALRRIGVAESKKVYFIITADYKKSLLTIHKPPKDFNLTDWIEKEILTEQEVIQRELSTIDAI